MHYQVIGRVGFQSLDLGYASAFGNSCDTCCTDQRVYFIPFGKKKVHELCKKDSASR